MCNIDDRQYNWDDTIQEKSSLSRKALISTIICSGAILLIALFALRLTSVEAGSSFQTWPSRTPTPAPGQTQSPGGSTPGGGVQPTRTEESSPTAPTPTSSLTNPTVSPLAPTVDQPFPVQTIGSESIDSEPGGSEQAGACDIPPLIQALGPVAVRKRVGNGNELVGYLQFSDLRTIIGRAADDPWWLIIFDSDLEGWVSDQAVLVHGYTGFVPIIEPGDATPAPGTSWNPTPNPRCTPPAPTVGPADATVIGTVANSGSSEEPESENNGQQVSSAQDSEYASTPADNLNISDIEDRQDEPQSNNSSVTWLLITGVFLVVVGAISLIIRRRNS